MIVLREASGLTNIGALFLREASGIVEIGEVFLRESGGLVEVYSSIESGGGAFTVDVTPDSFGARVSSGAGAVTTSEVTATPSGGVAPYTYLWERTDADPADWTIISPTSQSTTFRAAAVGPEDTFNATFTCTVTDANGSEVTSDEVAAQAVNYGTPL
jgi:hypothetical protein